MRRSRERGQRQATRQSPRQMLRDVLAPLTPTERGVLNLFHGIDDGKPRSYDEVAAELNISPEEAAHARHSALAQLREPTRKSKLLGIGSIPPTASFPPGFQNLLGDVVAGPPTTRR